MIEKTALVLEGGGFRGIFTAGILEVFLEKQLFFESVYGVSAGASYGASYISRQPGRNIAVNEYIGDKRYFSLRNWFREGSLFSWNFIYDELSQNLLPFDYQALKESESKFFIGTSNCVTGEAEFFLSNELNKKDFQTVLTASGSLPLIAPIVSYGGKLLLDGGLADSIPFQYALSHGHKRAVVILTRPLNYQKEPLKYGAFFKWYYRKHPKVYEMLLFRAERYNASLRQLEQLEKEGVVFVIRPEETLIVSRLENKPYKTARIYNAATVQAKKEFSNIQEWLNR
jgi:predicted patatin/cPLA2 family phospholipase